MKLIGKKLPTLKFKTGQRVSWKILPSLVTGVGIVRSVQYWGDEVGWVYNVLIIDTGGIKQVNQCWLELS
jgi:hypothetical protein